MGVDPVLINISFPFSSISPSGSSTFMVSADTVSYTHLDVYKRQEKKQVTFVPPFDFPRTLSGNFGEIRSNHFHGGLDFKTGGVIGKPVRAALSVSRKASVYFVSFRSLKLKVPIA